MPVQRRRRQTGRFANARRCWPPPVGLRPPYVAPAAAHSHQIAARFPPQILAPRGGHYWTRKGVTIGSDLTPYLPPSPAFISHTPCWPVPAARWRQALPSFSHRNSSSPPWPPARTCWRGAFGLRTLAGLTRPPNPPPPPPPPPSPPTQTRPHAFL